MYTPRIGCVAALSCCTDLLICGSRPCIRPSPGSLPWSVAGVGRQPVIVGTDHSPQLTPCASLVRPRVSDEAVAVRSGIRSQHSPAYPIYDHVRVSASTATGWNGRYHHPDLALAVASSGALGMLSAKETPLSELLDAVPVGAGQLPDAGREDFPAVQEAAARMPYVECFWAELTRACQDHSRGWRSRRVPSRLGT
jgi:hypothetical protein